MKRGLVCLVGACALTAAPIITAAGSATAATTSGISGPGHVLGLHAASGESPAAAIADAVQHVATSRFGGAYVGEVLTGNGTKVTVYLTQLDRSAETAITAGIEPGVVSFAKAPRSLPYLNGLHQNVTREHAWLKEHGIDVVTWGPDIMTGRENVAVYHLTPAGEAVLDKLFGAANLTLASTAQDYTAIAVGRDDDTAPWNGGDFDIVYNDGVTGECSTGYGAHSGSNEYLITAGHCAAVGALALNGSPYVNETSNVYTVMGETTTNGSFGETDGIDGSLIDTTDNGDSSIAVYTGSSTATQVDDVSGTTTSPKGDEVCSDGAFEGEICDLVIQNSASECITEAESTTVTYTVCDIYEAINTSGGVAVGNGDSGGPVFRFSGSDLEATGIVTAESGTDRSVCSTYQIPGFATRYCSPILYYTNISSILSEFGLKLNT